MHTKRMYKWKSCRRACVELHVLTSSEVLAMALVAVEAMAALLLFHFDLFSRILVD